MVFHNRNIQWKLNTDKRLNKKWNIPSMRLCKIMSSYYNQRIPNCFQLNLEYETRFIFCADITQKWNKIIRVFLYHQKKYTAG